MAASQKKSSVRSFTSLKEGGPLSKPQTTDSGGKVFRNVTLIKSGLGNRRDKNYYPTKVLRDAVESGMFEGIKAYADHQTSVDEEIQPERTVRDFVGLYSDTRFVEDKGGGRVVGDLRVLRSQKWLADTIEELIEIGAADKIGLSINGRGQTSPQKVKLEESGDEIEANVLERFLDVRSTDIVTEAGAGGGFQQLLESARGAAKETGMNPKQIVSALREAADAGDLDKVKTLTTKLAECGCDDVAESKKAKKKAAPVADEDDHEMEEADDEDDDVDPDAELEEAIDQVKEDADADDEDSVDEDDTEGADEDDEVEESDANTERATSLKRAANKLRDAREASIKGVAKGGGSFTKKASAKKGFKAQRHPAVREAASTDLHVEVARLRNRLQKTELRNERLAEALRVRQKADVARKLLKESGVPSELRADLVERLVRLPNEEAMQKEIRFQQRLLETAASRAREEFEDSFSEVEGAGSRVRESWGGGDDELVGLMRESGLPMRSGK